MSQNRIINLSIDRTLSSTAIMVIEAEEELWPQLLDKSCELINNTPGLIRSVYFLGNNIGYPCMATDFTMDAPSWFSVNKSRVSLIGPIYSVIEQQEGDVVVFCSKPPVDLDDWLDTDLFTRTVFVTTDSCSFPRGSRTLSFTAQTDRIAEKLHNPIEQIIIHGADFVPLRWEIEGPKEGLPKGNSVFTNNGFQLSIPLTDERISLHVQGICLNEPPDLLLQRQKRTSTRFPMQEEKPWFAKQEWEKIPEQLIPVLSSIRSRQPYRCQQCGDMHDHTLLVCPSGGQVLQGIPLDALLLFNNERFLPLADAYACPLQGNRRIINQYGEIFEATDNGWQHTHAIEYIEEVDENVWALFNSNR